MDKPNIHRPLIVKDLGSRKKKQIRELKNGEGTLLIEVDLAVEEARAFLSEADKNKPIVPVVIIYSKKGKKRRYDSLPFSPLNPLSLFRC